MTHPITEKLLNKTIKEFEERGISDYVVVVRDPDSATDAFRVCGSVFWRMGVGMDLIEDGKFTRHLDREKWAEEEDNEA